MAKVQVVFEDGKFLASQATAAKFFGISVSGFQKWNFEPIGKRGRENVYDLAECMFARYENSELVGQPKLMAERARLAKEQADKLEMENAAKRGELLHSEDVLKSWGGLITNARQALLSMSRRLSPVICHKEETEIEDAIEKEVRTILGDLAEPGA